VDLAALAAQLADYFEGPAAERGLRVQSAVSGQLQADPALLRQALANLIANAIRHGRPDGEVRLRSEQRDGVLQLGVWNAGPPIDAQHLPQLFERFYRADASRSGSGDSGGLGLAIVRSIARLHGGEVSVRSDADGTEFTVSLPLR
jgi:two-component system, OmpR family, heavy metal sensor histidine kinase CusS